jgi:hypothetical protein
MKLRLGVTLLAAAVTLAVLLEWRGFPLRLALVSAAAVGFLAYVTATTVENLRRLYRRR